MILESTARVFTLRDNEIEVGLRGQEPEWFRDGRFAEIMAKSAPDEIFIRIVPERLKFDQPKILGEVYWPGGEMTPVGRKLERPIIQVGEDWNRSDQLFCMGPRRRGPLYVIDTVGAVAHTQYALPIPTKRPAVRSEFAAYVERYTDIRMHNPEFDMTRRFGAARWGWKTLGVLKDAKAAMRICDAWENIAYDNAEASTMILK